MDMVGESERERKVSYTQWTVPSACVWQSCATARVVMAGGVAPLLLVEVAAAVCVL